MVGNHNIIIVIEVEQINMGSLSQWSRASVSELAQRRMFLVQVLKMLLNDWKGYDDDDDVEQKIGLWDRFMS